MDHFDAKINVYYHLKHLWVHSFHSKQFKKYWHRSEHHGKHKKALENMDIEKFNVLGEKLGLAGEELRKWARDTMEEELERKREET